MPAAQRLLVFIICAAFLVTTIGWREYTSFYKYLPQYEQSSAEHRNKQEKINYKETFWQRTTDEPIAVFNLLLVVFTAVLAVATIALGIGTFKLWQTSAIHAGHMEESASAAKKAAEAASRQAEAFIAVESPTPVFSGFKIVERLDASGRAGGRDPITAVPMPEFLQALILPINIGRAPLRIIRICIEYDIGESLPDQPFYYSITGTNIVLRNMDPGTWLVPEAIFQLDETQREDIDYNRKSLWVYGFLSYFGLLGEIWNLGFSARWDRHSGGLVQAGPQGYNYNRKVE
jgi:hypothetical protein